MNRDSPFRMIAHSERTFILVYYEEFFKSFQNICSSFTTTTVFFLSGGKSKELGAEAAAELAGEYFGGDKAAMTFAPVVNVEYDFEKDGYISFRETYKLGGTEYEKQFWLGADGKVYNITKNTLSSKMIVLSEGSEYIEFTGSALRVNRSQENYDYAAVKALLDK